jgi:hypothetical protein
VSDAGVGRAILLRHDPRSSLPGWIVSPQCDSTDDEFASSAARRVPSTTHGASGPSEWYPSRPSPCPSCGSRVLSAVASPTASGVTAFARPIFRLLLRVATYWLVGTPRRWSRTTRGPQLKFTPLRWHPLKLGGRVTHMHDRVRLRLAASHPSEVR